MAENYVENFSFGEGEDENTFQVKDPEAIEAEGGELANAIITYDNEDTSVKSWTDFISNFVSGTKIAKWFKDFKAGVEYVLHVGSLVNNCVTDNSELPLSAAQGKVLMDEITELNSAINEIVENDPMSSYGENIPANSDLNDYVTAGRYTMSSGTEAAATIANNPYTYGSFILLVMILYRSDYFIQILIGGQVNMYIYTRVIRGTEFGEWYRINVTAT